MECDRFDEIVLDLLYPVDPQTKEQAAARDHAAGCDRCGAALLALREAREITTLEPLPLPPLLAARILAAAQGGGPAPEPRSWLRAFDRFISIAGSYAMRPQLAMAALLLLMVGSSLLLLRARPAGPGAVRITEDGVPAPEGERGRMAAASASATPPVADRRAAPETHGARGADESQKAKGDTAAKEPVAPAAVAAAPGAMAPSEGVSAKESSPPADPAPAASSAAPSEDAAYTSAMEDYKAKRFADAARAFDVVANGGGPNGPSAALHAARATRFASGCGAALSRFDAVASRYAGGAVAAEATWEGARCYREVGQIDRAKQLLQALRRVAGFRDRAERELAELEQKGDSRAGPGAGRAAPAKPAARPQTDVGF